MYPYEREWSINSVKLERYVAAKQNWEDSKTLISKIRNHLSTIAPEISSQIQTIAAAGSLGRMEACNKVSDADLIVVLSDSIEPESEQATRIHEFVWNSLATLKLERPRATGVFAKPTTQKELTGSIGRAKEKYEIYSKRLLFLLETQPLYKDSNYTALIHAIVERYADKYVKNDSKKEWTLLLNDLIRYFRSLAVNYQWDFENEVKNGQFVISNYDIADL